MDSLDVCQLRPVHRMEASTVSDYQSQYENMPLFAAVETGLCRASDPQPSADGAIHIADKLTGKRALFAECLRSLGSASTASEVASYAEAFHGEPFSESIRKRASELVRLGVTDQVGTRQCRITGMKATVYWFAKGRA